MELLNRLLARLTLLCISAVLTSSTNQDVGNGAGLACNGRRELCDLRFDQVTLPGSHSSGTGFDGIPRQCNGMDGNDCLFQTQGLSIAGQLELGIRYLNLDICILPDGCNESSYSNLDVARLVSCRGSETDTFFNGFQYSGSLIEILRQVDEWMRNNTGEVIGIHFTRNIPAADRPRVFESLIPLLESKWGEGASNISATEMNTFYKTNSNTWPTLRQAVEANKRIFVFIDEALNTDGISRPWKNPTPFINFQPAIFDRSCATPGIGIVDHASRCDGTGNNELIIAIGYTLALCTESGQDNCNLLLQTAAGICYNFREEVNRTVNVILVDFPESGTGTNSVISVAMELNSRNIDRFYTAPPITTTEDPFSSSDGAMIGSGDTTSAANSILTSTDSSSSHSIFSYTITLPALVLYFIFSSC